MIHVRVLGVALDDSQQHVILLKPVHELGGSGRLLPVWIGEQEATSILIAVQGGVPPRPLSHDLIVLMLQQLGADVERVEVTRLSEGTFYAEITLTTPSGVKVIDARPSDAIAIAPRTASPVWVADEVFDAAAIPDTVSDVEEIPSDGAEEEKVDEFRRFLDEVAPEDFEP
ncbi:bifunctional nuclease family protein [Microbacterium sp. P05]|uniref:bifunctional nuclease family protein n=1 Tax=Microbacterium sp. P05 TaxID=3366948 RepID=UPI003746B833